MSEVALNPKPRIFGNVGSSTWPNPDRVQLASTQTKVTHYTGMLRTANVSAAGFSMRRLRTKGTQNLV